MQETNIRELRPFNPLLRSVHLESEPIKVIIDYVDSPIKDTPPLSPKSCGKCLCDDKIHQNTVIIHSPSHTKTCSIANIGNINDKNDIANTNNPIFTLGAETQSIISESNRYYTKKEKATNFRACPCSKSTFRKMVEHPDDNMRTRFTNTPKHQILDHKSNPSWKKMKNADKDKQINYVDKQKGSHWTCGTKMFSKSEKVKYMFIDTS